MLDDIGEVFAISTRAPIESLNAPFELMASWPCVYEPDGSISEECDYMSIVYVHKTTYSNYNVMDALKRYGPTTCRWITNFWRRVGGYA